MRLYHPDGGAVGRPLPIDARMYNTWFGERFLSRGFRIIAWGVACIAQLHNIKVEFLAIPSRWPIGQFVRYQSCTSIHNLEGCGIGVPGAVRRVDDGHHVGRNGHHHGILPPLFIDARIVYIDVRNVKRSSVDNVAFHSLARPTVELRKAKFIARTLWINHCRWAGILIVRGRRLSSHTIYLRSNRVLEIVLWHCEKKGRPFVVYKEGNGTICGEYAVPA